MPTLIERARIILARVEDGRVLPAEARELREIVETLHGDACPYCECERSCR